MATFLSYDSDVSGNLVIRFDDDDMITRTLDMKALSDVVGECLVVSLPHADARKRHITPKQRLSWTAIHRAPVREVTIIQAAGKVGEIEVKGCTNRNNRLEWSLVQ